MQRLRESPVPVFFDGEELRTQMREEIGRGSRRVVENLGEEGAVLKAPRGRLVVHTATLIEEVHFDLLYTAPKELGHKGLAVALSGLAALGARPLYAAVTVGLRQDQGDIFVAELLSGAVALARSLGVDVVAERAVPSPSNVTLSVTAMGEGGSRALTPAGARPGDRIVLCGAVGTSAAGLAVLKRLGRTEAVQYEEACDAHLKPLPRTREASLLVANRGVTAAVDVKDGLTRDIYRLTQASGVGCILDEGALPVSALTVRLASLLNSDARAWALYGGEDFGLIFTVRPSAWKALERALKAKKLPAAVIGEIRPKVEKVRLKTAGGEIVPLVPRVWSHFARRGRVRWR